MVRKVRGRWQEWPLSYVLMGFRRTLTYSCLGSDCGTLAMSRTRVPGKVTAAGPFFDRIALFASVASDVLVQIEGLENSFIGRFGRFTIRASNECCEALM